MKKRHRFVVLVVGSLLLGMLAIFGMGLRNMWRGWRSINWPRTVGVVTKSEGVSRHSTTETRIVGAENRVPSERTKRTVSTVFYPLIEYRHEVTDRSWTVNRVKFGGGVIEALANSPSRDEMDDADEKEENEAEAPWLASQGD